MSWTRRTTITLALLLLGASLALGCAEEEDAIRDVSGRDALILKVQTSYGECSGRCVSALTFSGSTVKLVIRDWDGTRYEENSGVLTSQGVARLNDEAEALLDVTLEETYGCPDCADGGATGATIRRDNIESSHVWETGDPPSALADLDAFADTLTAALSTCTTSDLIQISGGCAPAP